MKKIILAVLLFTLLFALSASSNTNKVDILVDTETVYISQQENTTTIVDRTADKEYSYKTVLKKKTDITADDTGNRVDTETIQINLLQHGDIEVIDKVGNEEYIIHPQNSSLITFVNNW